MDAIGSIAVMYFSLLINMLFAHAQSVASFLCGSLPFGVLEYFSSSPQGPIWRCVEIYMLSEAESSRSVSL